MKERITKEENCPAYEPINLNLEIEKSDLTRSTESLDIALSKMSVAIEAIKTQEGNSTAGDLAVFFDDLLTDPDSSIYLILCYFRTIQTFQGVARVHSQVENFQIHAVTSEAQRHCRDYNIIKQFISVLHKWIAFVDSI